MVRNIVPRNGNGEVDWMGYIRTVWPIAVVLIGALLWVNGRMESPAQKAARIELICSRMITERVPPREVTQRLDRIEAVLDRIGIQLSEHIGHHNGKD